MFLSGFLSAANAFASATCWVVEISSKHDLPVRRARNFRDGGRDIPIKCSHHRIVISCRELIAHLADLWRSVSNMHDGDVIGDIFMSAYDYVDYLYGGTSCQCRALILVARY